MRKMFYFDLANDRVLTMDEYVARLGIDIAKAKDGALWSYDLGSAGYAGEDAICADTLGGDEVTPENGMFYYKKYGTFDKSVVFDGISVSEDTVILYLTGHAFTSNIFKVALDRESLMPKYPNYSIFIDADKADEGTFDLRFENGVFKSATLPKGVKNVRITSSGISFDAESGFDITTFKINGEKWGLEYNASYDPETKGRSYYFKPATYIPSAELVSITVSER